MLHSLFASLSSFAVSSKMQFKICYREEFNRYKIHHMDKICLRLATFEEFTTALLQTAAKRCLSCHDNFLKSVAETIGACHGFENGHFVRSLGSIVNISC